MAGKVGKKSFTTGLLTCAGGLCRVSFAAMSPDSGRERLSLAEEAAHRARNIAARLRDAGHEALWAGGAVRDMLLGRPCSDIDIATSARPEEVVALFKRTATVGAHFGVVIVVEEGVPFEVATFRTDGLYLDGRRPEEIRFATAKEDALRRDFTINGMFYDPFEERVIDYVEGKTDLKAGVVRAIGDPAARFSEDKLRLLRCIRFAAMLGFKVESATWKAVKELASEIHAVSAERIREELDRMISSPTRLQALDLLDAAGLLQEVLPEVAALKGCQQPPQFHPEGDVFVHTRLMLSMLADDASPTLCWAVLLHDIGKPPTAKIDEDGRIRFNGHDAVGAQMTEQILRRLRFPNVFIERVVEAVAMHMMFKDVANMRISKLRRFMARPGFEEELELHRVDCLSSHGLLDNHKFLLAKEREFASEPLLPPPLIRGSDLIALGWKPGPMLGKALEAAQNARLEGLVSTREEALAYVKKVFGAPTQTPESSMMSDKEFCVEGMTSPCSPRGIT